VPPGFTRPGVDEALEPDDDRHCAAEHQPPVLRKQRACLDQQPRHQWQFFTRFLKKGRQLRHEVSHEQKNQADPQDKDEGRINQRRDHLFLQVIDRDQETGLPFKQLRQRTADLSGRDKVAIKVTEIWRDLPQGIGEAAPLTNLVPQRRRHIFDAGKLLSIFHHPKCRLQLQAGIEQVAHFFGK
jgi:hypothetical protein